MSKKKGSDHREHSADANEPPAPAEQDALEKAGELPVDVAKAETVQPNKEVQELRQALDAAKAETILPSEELQDLRQALEKARSEAEEYLSGWQRERAEFANFKKRVEREQEDSRQRITGEILTSYLGVLDDLRRALRDRPSIPEAEAWIEGIELIRQKLVSILEANGVEPVPAEGVPFDPNVHEAVTYEESGDHQSGYVIEVLQQGYRLGDRVLRPARVRVAK